MVTSSVLDRVRLALRGPGFRPLLYVRFIGLPCLTTENPAFGSTSWLTLVWSVTSDDDAIGSVVLRVKSTTSFFISRSASCAAALRLDTGALTRTAEGASAGVTGLSPGDDDVVTLTGAGVVFVGIGFISALGVATMLMGKLCGGGGGGDGGRGSGDGTTTVTATETSFVSPMTANGFAEERRSRGCARRSALS